MPATLATIHQFDWKRWLLLRIKLFITLERLVVERDRGFSSRLVSLILPTAVISSRWISKTESSIIAIKQLEAQCPLTSMLSATNLRALQLRLKVNSSSSKWQRLPQLSIESTRAWHRSSTRSITLTSKISNKLWLRRKRTTLQRQLRQSTTTQQWPSQTQIITRDCHSTPSSFPRCCSITTTVWTLPTTVSVWWPKRWRQRPIGRR